MLNPPKTREEARVYRYCSLYGVRWYSPDYCAWEIACRKGVQCLRKPGYGPDGLYCRQHAKKLEEHNAD